jgi:type II secretory pathway component GspD/PulD (secretin)
MDMISNVDAGGAYGQDDGEGGFKTKVYRLKNISLQKDDAGGADSKIVDVIKNLLTVEGEKQPATQVSVDDRTGSVIVTASSRTLKKVDRIFDKLDVKVQQVTIEAKLYEVNLNSAKDLGVKWSGETQNPEPFIKGDVGAGSIGGIGTLMIGSIQNGVKLNAIISALQSKSEATLLSSPKVTVGDNKKAKIETVRTTYYLTESVITSQTGAPTVTKQYQSITLPISLEVSPKITDEGGINMNVLVQVTKLLSSVSTTGPPDTTSQEARTNVVAKNNETIVIGGLITDRVTNVEEKVPLLGDLPLIGNLFKGTKEVKDKAELIIFLTPSLNDDN